MRFPFAAWALLAGLLRAQQSAPPPPVRQTMVVTGTASPVPLAEADRDVTVLPLTTEQRPLFLSLFDLLVLDPAIDLRQHAPGGFQGDISIRGASFGQTLILLDGMRLNDVQSGHLNLDIPVPFEAISSIEVLKGASSAFYGSDAIGGVLNIRTRTPEAPELRILAGAGNYGFNQQHAIGSFGTAKLWEQAAVARDFSTGFIPDRDYRNFAASSITGARTALGSSNVLLAYSDRPFGADQFYGSYPSWERTKTWFASAHQDLGANTEASFGFRRHTDLFVLFRDQPQIYTNRHAVESWQGDLRRHDNLPLHSVLSYGAEGLAESIDSSNLGSHHRKRASGYVFYDIRTLRRFSLSAGIREEVYGSKSVATSPSLSGAAWITSKLKLRASASRGFRLPSYTDLYYHDPANAGSPFLKPESAASYEAGADAYFTQKLRASLTVFHRRDTNGIDYVRQNPADIWRAVNFDKLHFTGLEASGTWEIHSRQQLLVSFASLRGISATDGALLSKYAFNYPVQNAVVEWRGNVGSHLVARTRIGAVHRLQRDAYALWDASAARSDGRIRPYLQLTNITGAAYEEFPGLLMPRRGIIGGLELVLWGERH